MHRLRAIVIFAALGMFWFVISKGNSSGVFAKKPSVVMKEVLVAKRDISIAEWFRHPEEFFEKKRFPQKEIPADAITSLEVLKFRIAKQNFPKGAWVSANELYGPLEPLDELAGFKAIGLRCYCELQNLPEKRVDVFFVRRQENGREKQSLLFKDVLVLAEDTCVGMGATNPQSVLQKVVTVALQDEDILRLNLAREAGKGTFRIALSERIDGVKNQMPSIGER